MQFSASVFAEANSLYVMIYKRNDSLQVSTGPSIVFELRRVTRTEREHKNLLLTELPCDSLNGGPSKTKPCMTIQHLRVFEAIDVRGRRVEKAY